MGVYTDPNTKEEYDIVKLLGQGAFGKVYLVKDKNGKQLVAKYIGIPPTLSKEKRKNFVETTKNEINILQDLSMSPNCYRYISCIYTYWTVVDKEYRGYFVIIMEYIEGETLRRYLMKYKFTPKAYIQAMLQLAEAVQYMHDRDIVHRDIKTDNIMVSKNGIMKLIDFGLSHIVSEKLCESSRGTPTYLSPEFINKALIDVETCKRIDIWALGIVFVEMWKGNNIVKNIYDTSEQVRQAPDIGNKIYSMFSEINSMQESDWYNEVEIKMPNAPKVVPNILNNMLVGMLARDPYERIDIYIVIDLLNSAQDALAVSQTPSRLRALLPKTGKETPTVLPSKKKEEIRGMEEKPKPFSTHGDDSEIFYSAEM